MIKCILCIVIFSITIIDDEFYQFADNTYSIHKQFLIKGTAQNNRWFIAFLFNKFDRILYDLIAVILLYKIETKRHIMWIVAIDIILAITSMFEFIYYSFEVNKIYHFFIWIILCPFCLLFLEQSKQHHKENKLN